MTDEDVATRLAALKREVTVLREELAVVQNRDIPLLKGTVRQITDGYIDSLDELPNAGQAFNHRVTEQGKRLDAVEERLAELGTIGQGPSSKEEKFAAILAFAQNKQNGTSKVSLSPHDIRGCAGVSRRYAYDLIEAMAAELDGVSVREPRRVQTGKGTTQKRKALLVDCEQVRTSSGDVNLFTTGGTSGEHG